MMQTPHTAADFSQVVGDLFDAIEDEDKANGGAAIQIAQAEQKAAARALAQGVLGLLVRAVEALEAIAAHP